MTKKEVRVEISEIIGGYIENDEEKAQKVLDYVECTRSDVKTYIKKIVFGGVGVMLLGMILMLTYGNAMMGMMYVGIAIGTFGGGMFLENYLRMNSITRPTIIRREAIEYMKNHPTQEDSNE